MKSPRTVLYRAGVIGVLVIAVVAFLFFLNAQTGQPRHGAAGGPGDASGGNRTPTAGDATGAFKNLPPYTVSPSVFLPKWLSAMRVETDRAKTSQLIAAFRKNMRNAGKAEAVAALLGFLNSGQDATTGLRFRVGTDGFLESAPTARVLALDELGQIDPAAARDYARTILAQAASPDEWSVALRNYALGTDPESGRTDPYFVEKAGELVQQAQWLASPTEGYLQGFDAVVYTGNQTLAPLLAQIVDGDYPTAAKYAARLALDRMVQQNYAGVLSELNPGSDTLDGNPTARADLYARADVRRVEEKGVVEQYLLNPSISASELTTFANNFPNANLEISNNLLTRTMTPPLSDYIPVDQASLDAVNQWLSDPRFSQRQAVLQQIKTRLTEFVTSAQVGQAQNLHR